jgi:hypothetical protein
MSQPNNSIKCKKPDSKKNQTERTCKICNDSFMGSGVAQCCSEKCVNANNIQWQRDSLVRKSKEKFTDKNPEMWVQCPECDLRTKMLTTNHLVQVHSISYEEFQGKYPNFQVTCKHLLGEQSERTKGDKNPGFNHGGKLSPFSKKFVGYSDYSDNEKESSIKVLRDESVLKKVSNNNDPKKVEYYIKRGATPDEAIELLSDSQTTFSKEICIEKHGEVEGLKIWSGRQAKWKETLSTKSDTEKAAINKKNQPK